MIPDPCMRWYRALCTAYGVDPSDKAWREWALAQSSTFASHYKPLEMFRKAFEGRMREQGFRSAMQRRYGGSP